MRGGCSLGPARIGPTKMEYNCPNCGAPIHFHSRVAIYTTCTHCLSNIVRRDMDLEKVGEVSELLNDMSPFQVGTKGHYKEKWFQLLGRIKVSYSRGMWSEWYALFEDNSQGWLAEAQGLYMMSFEQKQIPIPPFNQLQLDQRFPLGDETYIVDDRREITYLGSEGELPYMFKQNFKGYSTDLRGPNGKFLNFLYGPEGDQAFLGSYQPFDEFNFTNLRKLHGWN